MNKYITLVCAIVFLSFMWNEHGINFRLKFEGQQKRAQSPAHVQGYGNVNDLRITT